MMAKRGVVILLAVLILASCSGKDTRGGGKGDSTYRLVDTAAIFHQDDPNCSAPTGTVALTADSIGPLPRHATFGELLAICPGAKRDYYDYGGGIQPAALYFRFKGALIAAVDTTTETYTDSVTPTNRVGLWVISGDSVVLPGGHRFPQNLGQLRAAYPEGILDAAKGDDMTGVTARACALPSVLFYLGYDEPTPADMGDWPFDAKAASDSAGINRAEVGIRTVVDDSVCKGVATYF